MIHPSIMQKRIVVDQRGKIKSGKMGRNKANTMDIPMKLDHFNVEKFPELIGAYGEKPQRMIVFFPSDDIEEDMNFDFTRYVKSEGSDRGVKQRVCDGKDCTHRMSYEIKGKAFAAGEETPCICKALDLDPDNKDDKKIMCRADVQLKAYIYCPNIKDFEMPICYLFESHSVNSGHNILSHLTEIKMQFGRLVGIPFLLSVKMINKAGNVRDTYPVWNLQVLGTKTNIVKQLEATDKRGGAFMLAAPVDTDLSEQGVAEIESEDDSTEETVKAPVARSQSEELFGLETPTTAVVALTQEQQSLYDSFDQALDIFTPVTKSALIDWKNKNIKQIDFIPQPYLSKLWAKLNRKITEAA